MRRIALALLGGLLFGALCVTPAAAQMTGLSQFGRATGEMNAAGLVIAHPSLPTNSRAIVVNTFATEEEEGKVEVTVISRIPVSSNRIADLSPEVWQKLGLAPGSEVRIYAIADARPRPADPPPADETPPVDPPPVDPPPADSQSADPPLITPVPPDRVPVLTPVESREAAQPVITPGLTAGSGREATRSTEQTLSALNPVDPTTYQPAPIYPVQPTPVNPVQPAPIYPVQPTPAYPTQPAPVTDVLVIPGLPDPAANRVYRLQVGAFSAQESADRTAQLVASLGFHVVWEQSGTLFRVYAINVPAVLIGSAAQRLGTIGIREVWVRE